MENYNDSSKFEIKVEELIIKEECHAALEEDNIESKTNYFPVCDDLTMKTEFEAGPSHYSDQLDDLSNNTATSSINDYEVQMSLEEEEYPFFSTSNTDKFKLKPEINAAAERKRLSRTRQKEDAEKWNKILEKEKARSRQRRQKTKEKLIQDPQTRQLLKEEERIRKRKYRERKKAEKLVNTVAALGPYKI